MLLTKPALGQVESITLVAEIVGGPVILGMLPIRVGVVILLLASASAKSPFNSSRTCRLKLGKVNWYARVLASRQTRTFSTMRLPQRVQAPLRFVRGTSVAKSIYLAP